MIIDVEISCGPVPFEQVLGIDLEHLRATTSEWIGSILPKKRVVWELLR